MAYTHYTNQERADSDAVERAHGMLGQGKIAEAEQILLDVISRSPQFYVYSFETDKEIFVKFWTSEEYLSYIAITRNPGEPVEMEVIWLRGAYPRAHFLQAMIDAKRGEIGSAAERLDEALRLEPDHPECLCMLADITLAGRDRKGALDLYEMTLRSRPYMHGRTLAHAQASRAKLLEALGRPEEASESYAEAMTINPNEPFVVNVDRYRKSMESGDTTAPVAIRLDRSEVEADEAMAHYDPSIPPDDHIEDLEEQVGEEPTRVRKWWQVWRKD